MEKVEILKDSTKIVIKNLILNDLEKIMRFYRNLPPEDRKYLRVDVTDRNIVEQRIKACELGYIIRIIAMHGDKIVADGALELSAEEWRRHQGEIRVIVAKEFQHKGLGLIIMRELCLLAEQKKLEKIVVKMTRQQIAARTICRKLGFHQELIIPDYVRDLAGETQDLVIMTCDIKDFWKELEHFYGDSDWQRCR